MNDEVKLCPCCGESPKVITDEEGTFAWCMNVECALYGGGYLLERWQRRPLEEALQAEIAKLNEQINTLRRTNLNNQE